MKYLITLCLILTSTGVLAYEIPIKSVNLDKGKVYIEKLTQQEEERESTHNQILLRRTTNTPSKVQLGFPVMTNEDVCVRYKRTNIFKPNRYKQNAYYDQPNLLDNACIEFKNQPVGYNKWVTLDFDNAKKLEKDDQELIRFSFTKNENNTDVIDLNAQVINLKNTEEDYTIEAVDEGFFRNQGLSFLYQSQNQVVNY